MEKGRSMVEMLGVLAIIGVLSAAGLAGYSKAMFKHKMTQTIDAFSFVLQRWAELKEKDLGDNFSIETADDIIKYGLFPECQKVGDDYCKLPMGNLFVDSDTDKTITVGVNFTSAKACVAFTSVHWENSIPDEWWNKTDATEMVVEGPGDYVLYNRRYEISNLGINNIIEACEQQCEEGDCSFDFRSI